MMDECILMMMVIVIRDVTHTVNRANTEYDQYERAMYGS